MYGLRFFCVAVRRVKKTKIKIPKTILIYLLLYVGVKLGLSSYVEHMLRMFRNRVLRIIFRPNNMLEKTAQ
jgi:hypothetical protein